MIPCSLTSRWWQSIRIPELPRHIQRCKLQVDAVVVRSRSGHWSSSLRLTLGVQWTVGLDHAEETFYTFLNLLWSHPICLRGMKNVKILSELSLLNQIARTNPHLRKNCVSWFGSCQSCCCSRISFEAQILCWTRIQKKNRYKLPGTTNPVPTVESLFFCYPGVATVSDFGECKKDTVGKIIGDHFRLGSLAQSVHQA